MAIAGDTHMLFIETHFSHLYYQTSLQNILPSTLVSMNNFIEFLVMDGVLGMQVYCHNKGYLNT